MKLWKSGDFYCFNFLYNLKEWLKGLCLFINSLANPDGNKMWIRCQLGTSKLGFRQFLMIFIITILFNFGGSNVMGDCLGIDSFQFTNLLEIIYGEKKDWIIFQAIKSSVSNATASWTITALILSTGQTLYLPFKFVRDVVSKLFKEWAQVRQ